MADETRKLTADDVRAFLDRYLRDDWEGKAGLIACIMAQPSTAVEIDLLETRADRFAGAQAEPGPEAFGAGLEFAMSALVECHEGPHPEPTCPYAE